MAEKYHNTQRGSHFKPFSEDGRGAERISAEPSEQKGSSACDVNQSQGDEEESAFEMYGLHELLRQWMTLALTGADSLASIHRPEVMLYCY